jgi:hypothetical protein
MDLSGSESPLRYYDLQYMMEELFQDLSGAEMKIGAFNMIAAISGYLWNFHFNEKRTLDAKALVKTMDDAYTNLVQDMVMVQEESGIQIFTVKGESENTD